VVAANQISETWDHIWPLVEIALLRSLDILPIIVKESFLFGECTKKVSHGGVRTWTEMIPSIYDTTRKKLLQPKDDRYVIFRST
jgi:hypothetical protein